MLRARRTMTAVLAASAMFSPAVQADETEWAGFTCGFASTNDTTGVIQQNPDVQFGEMDGGPWTSFDLIADDGSGPGHANAAAITIHCWIQVNNPTPAHFPIPSAHCDFQGTGVAGGACQINYTATATDNIYLCTWVTMSHDGVNEEYQFDDDDDATNGIQCALAISAGA